MVFSSLKPRRRAGRRIFKLPRGLFASRAASGRFDEAAKYIYIDEENSKMQTIRVWTVVHCTSPICYQIIDYDPPITVLFLYPLLGILLRSA